MFKRTYKDTDGVIHIVAMPTSGRPFSACGKWNLMPVNVAGMQLVTCIPCWAREFLEAQIEAIRGRIDNAIGLPSEFLR